MRSPTRASELVTDVQEASLPPVREEDRHRPRGAAGRSRPKVLTADIRASSERHLAGRLTTTRIKGRGGTVRPCSYAYSWYYDQYERRRLPPARGDHGRRPAPPLDRRGEGLDRGREPRPGHDHLGGGKALRAAPEPAVRLAATTRGLSAARDAPGFVPVLVTDEGTAPAEPGGRIEIVLGPAVVRVGADVDAAALRRVLEAVRGLP